MKRTPHHTAPVPQKMPEALKGKTDAGRGVWIIFTRDDFAVAKQAALQAESEGFYSVSMIDHFFTPLGDLQTPLLECYTTLTAIAAVTERIRLTPCVTAVSFRTPPMVAKITSTLDNISTTEQITIGVGIPTKTKTGICISLVLFQPHQARQTYSKRYLHPDEDEFFVSGHSFSECKREPDQPSACDLL